MGALKTDRTLARSGYSEYLFSLREIPLHEETDAPEYHHNAYRGNNVCAGFQIAGLSPGRLCCEEGAFCRGVNM
jgi:hypothetical protein